MNTNRHELNEQGRARYSGHWLALVLVCISSSVFAQRERISFNDGWEFIKVAPTNVSAGLSYTNLKPWILPTANMFLTTNQFVRPTDDKRWELENWDKAVIEETDSSSEKVRNVTLPHDWGIEGPFQQSLAGETGKLPWDGVAWYVKRFTISTNDQDKRFVLEVDGAMSHATVWLNGRLIGGWPYGYASWQVDLTPFVSHCGEVMLAIRLENPKESSRWYPGGGIYRNVWLTKTAAVHVGQWGVQVTTSQADKNAATVSMKVNVQNDSTSDARIHLRNEIFELNSSGQRGASVGSVTVGDSALSAGNKDSMTQSIQFSKPKLWSVASPNRYVVVTTIKQGGNVVDQVETPFGIRTIEFTTTNGFLLNGERVKIQGVCNHHDLGALGTAFNTRAAERQLEILTNSSDPKDA